MDSVPTTPSTPTTPTTKRKASFSSCRFIPPRSPLDKDTVNYLLFTPTPKPPQPDEVQAQRSDYDVALQEQLLPSRDSKILPFHASPLSPCQQSPAVAPIIDASPKKRRSSRIIPKFPDKILDAPGLVDDYYLNLLDWSRTNLLAVALDRSVFVWNASTGVAQKLVEMPEEWNVVTSVGWSGQDRDTLAIGLHSGEIQLWDVSRSRKIRSMTGHSSRVGALSWSDHLVTSGSRDATIIHHDVRASSLSARNNAANGGGTGTGGSAAAMVLKGHAQEVCGLRWSPSGMQLASGGNDNALNIWDARSTTPRSTMRQHEAAVKALSWCPFHNDLLASGGGTADKKIRFWNTGNGSCLGEMDTKSQVCSLQWSVHDKEIVSSHGYSHNQLILWKYEGNGRIAKVAELTGHRSRVLHMALSPDGTTVVSGAADETLRFWRIFGSPTKSPAKLKCDQAVRGMMGCNLIR